MRMTDRFRKECVCRISELSGLYYSDLVQLCVDDVIARVFSGKSDADDIRREVSRLQARVRSFNEVLLSRAVGVVQLEITDVRNP